MQRGSLFAFTLNLFSLISSRAFASSPRPPSKAPAISQQPPLLTSAYAGLYSLIATSRSEDCSLFNDGIDVKIDADLRKISFVNVEDFLDINKGRIKDQNAWTETTLRGYTLDHTSHICISGPTDCNTIKTIAVFGESAHDKTFVKTLAYSTNMGPALNDVHTCHFERN